MIGEEIEENRHPTYLALKPVAARKLGGAGTSIWFLTIVLDVERILVLYQLNS
jgi:hypothetical protein